MIAGLLLRYKCWLDAKAEVRPNFPVSAFQVARLKLIGPAKQQYFIHVESLSREGTLESAVQRLIEEQQLQQQKEEQRQQAAQVERQPAMQVVDGILQAQASAAVTSEAQATSEGQPAVAGASSGVVQAGAGEASPESTEPQRLGVKRNRPVRVE